MAIIIGDIQGCFHTFLKLIAKIDIDKEIWLAGDIINRGPDSLKMLRWVYRNQDKCKIVLGNHDIHAIAALSGIRNYGKLDTLIDIKNALDKNKLIDFLRKQPFILEKNKICMVHAGVFPFWDWEFTQNIATELSNGFSDSKWLLFIDSLFSGNQTTLWDVNLTNQQKLIFATNIFSRMRYCSNNGELNLLYKKYPLSSEINDIQQQKKFHPWFELYNKKCEQNTELPTIVFGHWSDLGLYNSPKAICLDSGCVWGGKLSAIVIDENNPTERTIVQQSYTD